MTAPIVIFAYNRPQHTQRLVKSLMLNKESEDSDLYVFCDGPKVEGDKDVAAVRSFVENIDGFRTVNKAFRETNIGLAKNIISGVSEVLEKHDSVIVMEDDLIATPHLLSYMDKALEFYKDKPVFSIAGYAPNVDIPDSYTYGTYAVMRNCSWGWATWKDRWQKVDWDVKDFQKFASDISLRRKFDESGTDLSAMLLKQQTGEIKSWSIRFCYSAFRCGMPTIYPVKSFVINGGADGSGTNVNATNRYDTVIFDSEEPLELNPDVEVNPDILRSFRKTYNCSIYRQIINRTKFWKYNKSRR